MPSTGRAATRAAVCGLLMVACLAVAAPNPASAECGSPDPWPRFRDGAASASLVVAGTVREVTLDGDHGAARVERFRLQVDQVLRGRSRPSLPISGIGTSRGCVSWGIQVRDGDRIVVAFGPARTGIPGLVASVAYLQPVRRPRYQPRMQHLSIARVRQTLALSSADMVFFSADDGRRGRELWRTDGTPGGTRLVRDIRPGGGSDPRDLAVVDGLLFFSADDGIHGRELWVTDGTALGTRMVADLRPGPQGSEPRWVTGIGWVVAFSADDGIHGRELWGWRESFPDYRDPDLLANLRPDSDPQPGSDPRWLIEANGSILFSADVAGTGRELWRYSAHERPATVAVDIQAGRGGSRPRAPVEPWARSHFGHVLFSARTSAHGREPTTSGWREIAGVVDIATGPASSDPDAWAVTTRHVVFTADDGSGRQVWSMGRPVRVGERELVGADTVLVDEIATVSTLPLTDLAPREASRQRFAGPVALDRDRVVFGAHDADDGGQLYVSDGTPTGTVRLTDVEGGLDAVTILGHQGRAFVVVRGPGAEGAELWVTRGTRDSTRRVADIHPEGDARPRDLVGYHGRVLFVADDGSSGAEPWVSSGRPGGTRRILDVRPGPGGSDPRDLTVLVWDRVRYDTLDRR